MTKDASPTSFVDDVETDPVTGRKNYRLSRLSKLNSKRHLTKQEMDEIFLEGYE